MLDRHPDAPVTYCTHWHFITRVNPGKNGGDFTGRMLALVISPNEKRQHDSEHFTHGFGTFLQQQYSVFVIRACAAFSLE